MANVKAVIVTYNPDLDRFDAVARSVAEQFARVVVVDNGSADVALVEAACNNHDLDFIALGANQGIAAALNEGIKHFDSDFDWVVTLDQDSIIPAGYVTTMLSAGSVPGVGIYCPRVVDSRPGQHTPADLDEDQRPPLEDIALCIQSGAFFSKALLADVGPFDEWLFIDYVDYDYCYRTRAAGHRIVRNNQVVLDQEFGDRYRSRCGDLWAGLFKLTRLRVFQKLEYRPVVNPTRMYYRARNRLYCLKYLGRTQRWLEIVRTPLVYASIIFRSQKKLETAKMLTKGTRDGIRALRNR